jgi:hypothetical protein
MTYRIKITTFANGRKEYVVQVKKYLLWFYVCSDGEESLLPSSACESREKAIRRIDLNYESNSRIKKKEFEYVNK